MLHGQNTEKSPACLAQLVLLLSFLFCEDHCFYNRLTTIDIVWNFGVQRVTPHTSYDENCWSLSGKGSRVSCPFLAGSSIESH